MTNNPPLLPCPLTTVDVVGDGFDGFVNLFCNGYPIALVPPGPAKDIKRMIEAFYPPPNDVETLAKWMIHHSFATGHGDTLEGLLNELSWQIAEIRRPSVDRDKVRAQPVNCPMCGEYDREKEFCCPGCGSKPEAKCKNDPVMAHCCAMGLGCPCAGYDPLR